MGLALGRVEAETVVGFSLPFFFFGFCLVFVFVF